MGIFYCYESWKSWHKLQNFTILCMIDIIFFSREIITIPTNHKTVVIEMSKTKCRWYTFFLDWNSDLYTMITQLIWPFNLTMALLMSGIILGCAELIYSIEFYSPFLLKVGYQKDPTGCSISHNVSTIISEEFKFYQGLRDNIWTFSS